MPEYIDLRSDTVTKPTPAMRAAMANAPVGDDVFGDDPTVRRLEELAAARLGKEAALFVPTGCMGNQLAVMTHTTPGDEIIVGRGCHIVSHELAAAARISGVAYAIADAPDGSVRAEDVEALARPEGPFNPCTGLVCMENALGNGRTVPLAAMQETYAVAAASGIPVHLDGARLFNAALALGVDARKLADCADSVMFCVSKGLCAPVGSLLCGSKEFIARAWKNRKLLGGGMRQAGVLAACGILSLDLMTKRLAEDHENARLLAERLGEIPGVEVQADRLAINMVFFKAPAFNSEAFVHYLYERGIKALGEDMGEYRLVTHRDVSREDVLTAAGCIAEYAATL